MAHYSYLDENNIVFQIIVGRDETDLEPGVNSWEELFASESGFVCLRTSRNTRGGIHYDPDTLEPSDDQSKSFRKNFGNIGFTYDEARDGFIPPKPFDSWVLDEATCLWQAPIEYPADGGSYTWDETEGDWVEVPDEAVE